MKDELVRQNVGHLSRKVRGFDLQARLFLEGSHASEREAWAGSWGDVMIAHMLRANVRFAITPAQVFGLHKGGMGWTMVAGGLGLAVGPFVRAVESESRVAIGEVQPDGKLPAIGPAVPGNTSINAD